MECSNIKMEMCWNLLKIIYKINMKTLVMVNTSPDFSLIEISETGTHKGCHRTSEGTPFEELEWAEAMIIPFTDLVVTNIKEAWRKDSNSPWILYTNGTGSGRYIGNQLITNKSIYCTTAGVFCTQAQAMVELKDEEGNSFDPKQYSTTEYNEGYTNFYDFWDSSVGVAIKSGIGVGMMAR